MKKRIAVMCGLVLAASLSSCAPSVTGPNGERYQPQVRLGGAAYLYEHVRLAEMTDQTPDDASVFLPDCSLAAVSARDVRILGVEKATDICSDTASNQLKGVGGVMVVMEVVAAVTILPFFYFLIRILTHIDTF